MSYQLRRSVSEKKKAKEFSFSNKYVIALGIALGYRLKKALFRNPPRNEYVLTAPVERSRDGEQRGKERGVEYKTRGCPPASPIPTYVEGDVPPPASFLVDVLYSEPIVMYVTSMSCVRKTFQECNAVRAIFQSYACEVDERDISMDKNVREEYKQRMGGPRNISALPVPQVFIGKLYIGGHTDITELNEIGELKPILMHGGHLGRKIAIEVCTSCADKRFVMCTTCDGSRKIRVSMDHRDDRNEFRCPDCNENGLVNCGRCHHKYHPNSPYNSRTPIKYPKTKPHT